MMQTDSIYLLLFVGHCYDSLSGNPPRGLQFVLGTNSTPAAVDTIVMANLVCMSDCLLISSLSAWLAVNSSTCEPMPKD